MICIFFFDKHEKYFFFFFKFSLKNKVSKVKRIIIQTFLIYFIILIFKLLKLHSITKNKTKKERQNFITKMIFIWEMKKKKSEEEIQNLGKGMCCHHNLLRLFVILPTNRMIFSSFWILYLRNENFLLLIFFLKDKFV